MKLREQLKQAFALDAYADYFALEASPQDYETFFSEINPEAPSLLHQDFEMNGRMYIADEGALRISALRASCRSRAQYIETASLFGEVWL